MPAQDFGHQVRGVALAHRAQIQLHPVGDGQLATVYLDAVIAHLLQQLGYLLLGGHLFGIGGESPGGEHRVDGRVQSAAGPLGHLQRKGDNLCGLLADGDRLAAAVVCLIDFAVLVGD